LLDAVATLRKCSPYLHVPAQSGSNEVLARMKRGYTVEDYREMMGRIRERLPRAAITSDFIVGFCGETDEDFQKTYDLVAECRFKNSFIFKYSERPGTKGAELFADDVPDAVKRRRNNELLAVQNAISEEANQDRIGRTFDVLVEGPSKVAQKAAVTNVAGTLRVPQPGAAEHETGCGHTLQLTGRTMWDHIVVFDGTERQIGQILPVTIYEATAHTLFGAVVTEHVGPEVYSLS
jgi:tRNA-2-methylthio-N6-dimethylallyladenosine synthase